MAGGTPCIVTTTGGSPELIENGRSGYVVEAGNVVALHDTIKTMLDTPDGIKAMGEKARIRIDENFNLQQSALDHVRLFESLIRP